MAAGESLGIGESGAENVRLRIREEMDRKGLSMRELAQLIQIPVSTLGHILSGYSEMRVTDMFLICWGVGLSPVEVVRDRGMEFCQEMTTSEFRLFERIKQTPKIVDNLIELLNVYQHTAPQKRHAGARKRPRKP